MRAVRGPVARACMLRSMQKCHDLRRAPRAANPRFSPRREAAPISVAIAVSEGAARAQGGRCLRRAFDRADRSRIRRLTTNRPLLPLRRGCSADGGPQRALASGRHAGVDGGARFTQAAARSGGPQRTRRRSRRDRAMQSRSIRARCASRFRATLREVRSARGRDAVAGRGTPAATRREWVAGAAARGKILERVR